MLNHRVEDLRYNRPLHDRYLTGRQWHFVFSLQKFWHHEAQFHRTSDELWQRNGLKVVLLLALLVNFLLQLRITPTRLETRADSIFDSMNVRPGYWR